MQLKEYQQRALSEIRNYLEHLASWKKKADANPDLGKPFPGHRRGGASAESRRPAAAFHCGRQRGRPAPTGDSVFTCAGLRGGPLRPLSASWFGRARRPIPDHFARNRLALYAFLGSLRKPFPTWLATEGKMIGAKTIFTRPPTSRAPLQEDHPGSPSSLQ